jgi:adenosylhomocysteine nucleosidase
MGQQTATAATLDVISLHQVKCVISAGFATGLDVSLKRGHILMADEVADIHGQHLPVDLHVRRESLTDNPALHIGRLLTIDHLLRTAEEKHRLGENHAALAANMETLGVAQACQQRGVRFLAVSIISDTVDDELPKEIELISDQKSLAAKLGAAAGALWKQPSMIKEMWQLKEDAIKASDRLAKSLAGVVENLPPAQVTT